MMKGISAKYTPEKKQGVNKENIRGNLLDAIYKNVDQKLKSPNNEINKETEAFRISSELLKNESIFLSDYLSNRYLKSDDLYLLQLLILENDLVYNMKLKERFEESKQVMEENLSLCKEENGFLKERLKKYDDNDNEDQFKLFETEILKIREMLNEKTTDIIKFEGIHKKNYEELTKNFNQVKQNLEDIKEENYKYSEGIKNISANLDQNNLKGVKEIIKNLTENSFNAVNHNLEYNTLDEIENTQMIGLFDDRSDPSIMLNNEKNSSFANKVIEEFDKVFNTQIKRLQNHYKKPEELKQKRRSSYVRRSSGVKNYVAYDGKSPNQKFAEGLRSSDKDQIDLNRTNGSFINNFSILKTSNLDASTSDLDNMLNGAKDRVRSSINYGNIINNNGSSSENKIKNMSHSPLRNKTENSLVQNKNSDLGTNQNYNKSGNVNTAKKNNMTLPKQKESNDIEKLLRGQLFKKKMKL